MQLDNATYCKGIMVKFKDSKRPAEIFRLEDVDGATLLELIDTGTRLTITYCKTEEHPLKSVTYNLSGDDSIVAEWTCSKLL